MRKGFFTPSSFSVYAENTHSFKIMKLDFLSDAIRNNGEKFLPVKKKYCLIIIMTQNVESDNDIVKGKNSDT